MATTYTLINSNVLSSSAASVTFSSIPATYTDLVLKVSVRNDISGDATWFDVVLNADTASNYSSTILYGTGSAAGSFRVSITRPDYTVAGATATSNTFSNGELYFPSYTASQNKPISAHSTGENNSTTSYMAATAMLWRNTAAITSIQLKNNSTYLFQSGSSFYLYGISNA